MSIYGLKSINGSVKWLSIPCPSCDDGTPWMENLLCPSPCWVDGVKVRSWFWGIQTGVNFGIVDVLWYGAVPDRAA